MSLIVSFSGEAIETYLAIQSQIRNRWGENTLTKFEHRTVNVLDRISRSPLIFQAIAGNADVRKAVIHKNCSVFYEIKETEIEVLFFWDNRQDPIFL